jgi:deoxyribodipyrimidine photo-lyase
MSTALVLFRQDLRLADNPALHQGARLGTVIPAYVLDDAAAGDWRMGGASRWWLHHSLAALDGDLQRQGSRLILRRGDFVSQALDLAKRTGADAVFWNRHVEPWAQRQENTLQQTLAERGIATGAFNANLLFEPGAIRTQSGGAFSVFTPFWRACRAAPAPAAPLPKPKRLTAPDQWPASEDLAAWRLLPSKPNWAGGLRAEWQPGEAGARKRLRHFLEETLRDYPIARDRPDTDGTSRLSPHLHFGEIGPRQLWHAAHSHAHAHPAAAQAADKFLSELGWREFSYNILHVHPRLPERNLRQEFDRFPWRRDAAALRAWQQGRTGYPIVDAGMRQLWQTGWMHNRVRMITASFLIKHLLIDWHQGQRWFWDTLVDADLANNAASWQWVAGSGADAAPYFRIFNPVLQGQKFDSQGEYVSRWVPELRRLEPRFIHAPWTASESQLRLAGIERGTTYPKPMVDHAAARSRALAAFASLKEPAP